jgi:predicted transcriptional regulator
MQIPTGDDIRSARLNKELTQTELANRAGVSQPLIARIEGADVDPTIDTLYQVVAALNKSTTTLEEEDVQISMPEVLKDARKHAGYTQGELAEIASVSQPLISRIEHNDVNPRASTLRNLFNYLETPPTRDGETGSQKSLPESEVIEKIEREFKTI